MPRKNHDSATARKAKTKSGRKTATSKTVKGLEKKLALMGYVRGKDWSPELILTLQEVEQSLQDCAQKLKTLPEQSMEETEVIERLQGLEIQRFQLLGQLHGNRVNDYHTLIS